MYKKISKEIIKKTDLKSELLKFIENDKEELSIKEWVEKYRNVVPAKEIIWLLSRREFMSEKDLRLFSVWCAREALKLIENPDERSINACNVAEKFANGEATIEELNAAYYAAIDASMPYYYAYYKIDKHGFAMFKETCDDSTVAILNDSSNSYPTVVYSAFYQTYYNAARAAARAAENDDRFNYGYYTSFYTASAAAYNAIRYNNIGIDAYNAAYYDVYDSAYNTSCVIQLEQLLTYFD
jgi:hypothetical protein